MGLFAVSLAVAGVLAGCSAAATPTSTPRQEVVRVPQDASLAQAGSRVAPGGVILIAPGTYHESLDVRVDDVTVRGSDRNDVILDGQLTRQNGIVATGARVAIENLTVRNFLQNGVLVTGITDENGAGVARGPDGYVPEDAPDPVPGYLVQYVTANNNGLYGIYAFNRTGGVIRDNLASGGSDSGIYVGQCADCAATVQSNVVVSNAVGMEFANASNVAVVGNRIVGNRVGVSVLSNYLEAHGPSSDVRIVGNVIADNNEADTPVQADGAFGVGIGLGGTDHAVVRANRISGNSSVGLWITSSENFAPTGSDVGGDVWKDNGIDVAFAPSAHAAGSGNCFRLPHGATTTPDGLASAGCDSPIDPGAFDQPTAPAGIVFSKVPLPDERPGLDAVDASPRSVPDAAPQPDLAHVDVPGIGLLAGKKR